MTLLAMDPVVDGLRPEASIETTDGAAMGSRPRVREGIGLQRPRRSPDGPSML